MTQVLIAPAKEAVYPEHLPPFVTPARRRRVHDVIEAMKSSGPAIVYPLDQLLKAKREMRVFEAGDLHWSDWGAYAAYRELGQSLLRYGLELDLIPRERLTWRKEGRQGTLEDDGSSAAPVAGFRSAAGSVTFDNGLQDDLRVVVIEREEPGPRCLVIGDRPGLSLLKFLGETFTRTVFCGSSVPAPLAFEAEQPDVAIYVVAEASLAMTRWRELGRLRTMALTGVEPPRAAGARAADASTLPLSRASFEDLRALGMSVTQAKRVLRARREGGLRSVEEIDVIPGFPRSFREELKQRLAD